MPPELSGYRVLRSLGVGARSTISLAKDLNTGRDVAIKQVIRNGPEDDRFIEQAEVEYKVSSPLDHRYLRKCLSIHRVKKLLSVREVMLVMEHVEGLPLQEARPNRLNTFLIIAQRVAQGLQSLHASGYVHSDIKPNNIMLGANGVLKIIDFGQSCPIGHRKGRVQGTPDYIAPEQVRRMPLDERTDVYNLGATLYWLLTSENYPTALQGASTRGEVRLLSGSKPLAPIELNDKIPLSLSNLVMECCRDNPAERPSDMQQLLGRLGAVQKVWQKQLDNHRARRQSSEEPAAGNAGESATEQA